MFSITYYTYLTIQMHIYMKTFRLHQNIYRYFCMDLVNNHLNLE